MAKVVSGTFDFREERKLLEQNGFLLPVLKN